MYKESQLIDRVCETCIQPFKARPSQIKANKGRFCSHRCYALSRTYDDLATRLWQKIDKTAGENACWPWTGYLNPDGYGRIGTGGKSTGSVHRITYDLSNGPIPKGKEVLHRCDNPPCCNPAHLFLGTQSDNIKDMIEKGRLVTQKGEKHPSAKLTATQVTEIRRQATGVYGETAALARQYGISYWTMRSILDGTTWK